MRKNKFKFAIITALMASLAIMPILANTREGEDETYNSDVTVSFSKPDTTDPVEPVDPDPEVPGGEDPEGGTGSKGDLTIDYVPNLRFPETKITNGVVTLKSTSLKPYVQVSDRRATGIGWKLSAELKPFVSGNGAHTITDAKVTLSNGAPLKADAASNSEAPIVPTPIELAVNAEKPVMTAPVNHGLGTWLATWIEKESTEQNSKVELEINTKDALVGPYSSEIVWTLSQQP